MLKVEPVYEKLRRYNSVLLRHVTRMYNNRIPKVMLNYALLRIIDRMDKHDLEDL
jgi:hypothetical protein